MKGGPERIAKFTSVSDELFVTGIKKGVLFPLTVLPPQPPSVLPPISVY